MSDSWVRNIVHAEWTARAPARFKFPAAHLSGLGVELIAIILITPLFLYGAAWNGFPFMFFDSGAYVLEGFHKFFVPERSPVYSLFLAYAHGRQSLWYVVWIQSAMTAFVITEFTRALWPRATLWLLLRVCIALALLTSIAWFVGQIEPDCMTAVFVLAMYPMAFRLKQLGWVRAILLVPVGGLAIASHPSHLGTSAGLVLCLIALRLAPLIWRRRKLPRPNLYFPLATFLVGLGLVLAANYAITEKVFVSRSGPIFLTARLIGDGVVTKTLNDICPTQPLKLCAYKDRLHMSADAYLWSDPSPFNKLGRFYGDQKEYSTIVAESLKRYPIQSVGMGLWGSLRQYFMFRTGDGVEPQEWVLNPLFYGFMPKQLKAYREARQQRGTLRFPAVNVVHFPLALGAQVWLGVVMWRALKRGRWNMATLPAFVLLALIGNALVCGSFSGPHDRYQSRLAWLPCMIVLLTARQTLERALRRPIESGT